MKIDFQVNDNACIQKDIDGKFWIDGREVVGWSLELVGGTPIKLVPVMKPKSDENVAHG